MQPSKSLVRKILLSSGTLLFLAYWQSAELPTPNDLLSDLKNEPIQTITDKQIFNSRVGGITYTIRPLYKYDLYGLVVSKHDADTWWDYIHREANDRLNVSDICVVWGKNAQNGSYLPIHFSSGQFTCYWKTNSSKDFAAFDQFSISNNHLLTDQASLAKIISHIKRGDQIHFSGYLAEYEHHNGFHFKRGTSIVRTDTGNHACETVFVEKIEILKRASSPWNKLFWLATALFITGCIMWFYTPVSDFE